MVCGTLHSDHSRSANPHLAQALQGSLKLHFGLQSAPTSLGPRNPSSLDTCRSNSTWLASGKPFREGFRASPLGQTRLRPPTVRCPAQVEFARARSSETPLGQHPRKRPTRGLIEPARVNSTSALGVHFSSQLQFARARSYKPLVGHHPQKCPTRGSREPARVNSTSWECTCSSHSGALWSTLEHPWVHPGAHLGFLKHPGTSWGSFGPPGSHSERPSGMAEHVQSSWAPLCWTLCVPARAI